jgi:hypothetical protein
MRAFACPTCGRLVTFESTRRLHCETALAFDPGAREIVAREAHGYPLRQRRSWPAATGSRRPPARSATPAR